MTLHCSALFAQSSARHEDYLTPGHIPGPGGSHHPRPEPRRQPQWQDPPPRSFCCVSNSIIAGTQFGAGLPRSAHARAQSDRAVRLTAGHAQNEGALQQTESQKFCH